MEETDLEKRAVAELLQEARRGAARAEVSGPSGWTKCPLLKANKRFLANTLVQHVTSNRRIAKETKRRRSRSPSPPKRERKRSRPDEEGEEAGEKGKKGRVKCKKNKKDKHCDNNHSSPKKKKKRHKRKSDR